MCGESVNIQELGNNATLSVKLYARQQGPKLTLLFIFPSVRRTVLPVWRRLEEWPRPALSMTFDIRYSL